jgi:hypothetical protein
MTWVRQFLKTKKQVIFSISLIQWSLVNPDAINPDASPFWKVFQGNNIYKDSDTWILHLFG